MMIEEVVASVALRAKKKNIVITVACEQDYSLYFNIKFTSDAIFNVLENSIKYTPEAGKIDITAERLEMFTKFIIQDTRVGIDRKHINDII